MRFGLSPVKSDNEAWRNSVRKDCLVLIEEPYEAWMAPHELPRHICSGVDEKRAVAQEEITHDAPPTSTWTMPGRQRTSPLRPMARFRIPKGSLITALLLPLKSANPPSESPPGLRTGAQVSGRPGKGRSLIFCASPSLSAAANAARSRLSILRQIHTMSSYSDKPYISYYVLCRYARYPSAFSSESYVGFALSGNFCFSYFPRIRAIYARDTENEQRRKKNGKQF